MSTLLISDIFPPKTGGSGRWFWEVYRRLPRDQFIIAAGEDPRQSEFDRTHDLRLIRTPLAFPSWGILNSRGMGGYCQAVRVLRKLIATEQVTMIHCGRSLPEGWIAWMLRRWTGVPYLCFAHGEELNYAASSRELSWMVRRVLRGAECVIANSHNTARIMQEEWQISAPRLHLLHPGVDTQRFVPAPRSLSVRQELGWAHRPVVLTVGRLQKRKGHDMLINALPTIRQRVPDILYAIAGDGEERRVLEELVAQRGLAAHVQFCGEVDDDRLIRCYQQCDLFVLPNRQVGQDIEGFGMVLVEAQACGRPVVAGSSGGTAETMSIPASGLVVPCEQPCELAAVVLGLLTDRTRLGAMGEAARRWVIEHFDWLALVRQAERLFAGSRSGSPAEGT